MAGEESGTSPINKALIMVGAGVIGVIVLIFVIAAVFSGSEEPDPAATPTTGNTSSVTATTVPLGPEVSPIEACALLTIDEVEAALGVTLDDIDGLMSLGGGEACVWQPMIDGDLVEDVYVGVRPGNAADFEEGAERDGLGEATAQSDVGGAAVWFSSQGTGVLSVIEPAEVAYALVEIEIANPSLNEAALLENAKTLAGMAFARLAGEGPESIEVDLCDLVSDADAEAILAPHREGRAAARDEIHVIGPSSPVDLAVSADTSCQKLILTEVYVEVAVGDASDFGSEANLEGVVGEPINSTGDEATWFAQVPVTGSFSAPHEAGVLAVRQGEARFRILLALPDIDSSDQLEVAKDLASAALTRISAGDVEVVTVDRPKPDQSSRGLVGNLLAKEERGEWSLGQGLVASLQLMIGESDPTDVLIHPEMEIREGTGIVRMAYAYLEDGDNEEIKAELERLLGRMFFTFEQLEQMAGTGAPTASLGGLLAAAEAPEDCRIFFEGYKIPIGVLQCLEQRDLPGFDGYYVFGPAPPLPMAGWTESHFELVIEALEESVPHFKSIGELPPVYIVLSVANNPKALAMAAPRYAGFTNRPCGIALFTNMQSMAQNSETDFKQVVAHELAHCFHGDTFREEYVPGAQVEWWDEGMAEYLSNTVPEYAANDLEQRDNLPEFDAEELATTIFDRSYENFIFFQQLARSYGDAGLFNVIRNLPDGEATREQQADGLADFSGMSTNYHTFVKNVTDIAVVDTDNGVIPNAPDSDPYRFNKKMLVINDVERFGTTRLAVAVDDGMYACIAHDVGDDVQVSWRPGLPGAPTGEWTSGLPDVLSGEVVIVASTTEPDGRLDIEVKDVADNDDCEPEEDDSNTAPLCFDFCGISAYYRYPEALSDWVADLLPPLS